MYRKTSSPVARGLCRVISSVLFLGFLLCVVGYVPARAATVTPAQWVASQTAPTLNTATTMPRLSTFWPYPASIELNRELAERWGYYMHWNGYCTTTAAEKSLVTPTSTNAQLNQLAISNPSQYPLRLVTSREYIEGTNDDSRAQLPSETFLRDKQGNPIGTFTWSPEAPISVIQGMANARANGLHMLTDAGVPLNGMIQNGGEYGYFLMPSEMSAMRDPVVRAARGTKFWETYVHERQAAQADIVTSAIRAATPNRSLYIHYTADCARDRGARTWNHPGSYGYPFEFPWLEANTWPLSSWSDLPSGETYYRFGWGCGGVEYFNPWGWDMLSQELNGVAMQRLLGHNTFYYWLDGTKGDVANIMLPKYSYMGYLKCLYTAGMIGGVEQSYSTTSGFNPQQPDAAFDDSTPPRWLQSFLWQSHTYALFTHLDQYIANSDLLPGPMWNRYSMDMRAYEFPTVPADKRSENIRILVRRAYDASHEYLDDWLVTAWRASDSSASVISQDTAVEIPDLGRIAITARSCGSVYRVRKNAAGEVCVKLLDPNPDFPSEAFPNNNEAPIGVGQTVHTLVETPVAVTLKATDVDADALTYTVTSQPQQGSLSGTAPNLTYTPPISWAGTTSFTFTATDGSDTSAATTVTVNVTVANTAPTASGQAVSVTVNTPTDIRLTGADPDGDQLTYTVINPPVYGTLSGTAPDVTYTPFDNWSGADEFSFTVDDGSATSTPATVAITVPAFTGTIPTVSRGTIFSGSAAFSLLERPMSAVGEWRNGVMNFTLSAACSVPVVVKYTVSGTATPGVDYEALPGTLTIPPGQTSAIVRTVVYDDAITEGKESIILTISTDAFYTRGATYTGTAYIFDDEMPSVQVLRGNGNYNNFSEAYEYGLYNIHMMPPPPVDTTIAFTMSGTATEGTDYDIPACPLHTVMVPAGSGRATVVVVPRPDHLNENSETVTLILAANAAFDLTLNNAGTLTLYEPRINCGGTFTAPYQQDTLYTNGATTTTTHTVSIAGVTNPAPATVYKSARTGACSYTIPELLPNGNYTARLHFAEITETVAGARVFDLAINGMQVLDDFDIFATAGHDQAVVRDFPCSADADGRITLALSTVTGSPLICGIELLGTGALTTTATPVFSPAPGLFTVPTDVSITCATAGATIRYTTDGTEPSRSTGTVYTGPMTLTGSTTLKAIAYTGTLADSTVRTGAYTINKVAKPILTIDAGTYPLVRVPIVTYTEGATIRYTTDSTDPSETVGTIYTGPIEISTTTTLKAVAYKTGMETSAIASNTYTITCGAPTVTPEGGNYIGAQMVTLTSVTPGVSMRYTTNGSTPSSTAGTLYTGPIAIETGCTLKAIAYKTGATNSSVVTQVYTIQCPSPTFNPAAGPIEAGGSVSINSALAGVTIRYTTDGADPSSTVGTVYTNPVTITEATTLKAIAYKTGCTDSAIASAAYTIGFQEIAIEGNGVVIAHGDTTPANNDDTDFSATTVTGGTHAHTFTIRNTGYANLMLTGTPKVAVSGMHAGDFTVTTDATSPVTPGGQTTFIITFDPTAQGARYATVTIASNDQDEPAYTFDIRGWGGPSQPPVYADLAFWVKPETISRNGSSLTSWADASGLDNSCISAGSGTTVVDNLLNGYTGVHIAQWYGGVGTTNLLPSPLAAGTVTCFAVYQMDDPKQTGRILSGAASNIVNGTSFNWVNTAGPFPTAYQAASAKFTTTRNIGLFGIGRLRVVKVLDPLSLGWENPDKSPVMNILEVLVYHDDLSTDESNTVLDYLKTKYNLP